MDRRRFCEAVLVGTLGSLAGCNTTRVEDDEPPSATRTVTATPEPTAASEETVSMAETGQPTDICKAEIIEDFNIKAIVDPAFGSNWRDHEIDPKYLRNEESDGLVDSAAVIGRKDDGHARAYPLSVLWHHEIINDTHGVPLIVTYCSICRSGLVADRRVRGEPTLFGVSGQLWHPPDRAISASAQAGRAFGANRWNASEQTEVREGANLVMYDARTRSFWSQAIAQAICGPMTGTRLSIVPSTLASWAEWREAHPETEIILPPPYSAVDE